MQINNTPPRIQRFILFLQKYDFSVEYVPGKKMICSDTMSRAALNNTTTDLSPAQTESQVHSIMASIPVSDTKLDLIKEETAKDHQLQTVVSYVNDGWPHRKSDVTQIAKPFFNVKHELSVINDVLMKGTRIVIPNSLQAHIKEVLHTGHLGIERTKSNARQTIFWPGIDKTITDMVTNCNACQIYRNKQQKESLIPHHVPTEVWSKVGIDLFTCLNRNYLVIIDYTTKFFETLQLLDTRSSTVIIHLKSIFAQHGIPRIVMSYNGPQFTSAQYREFAKTWDFESKTSSPELWLGGANYSNNKEDTEEMLRRWI